MNRVVCLSSSVVPKPNKIDAISADSRQKVGQTVLASQQPAVIGAGDDKGTDERDPEAGSQYGGPEAGGVAFLLCPGLEARVERLPRHRIRRRCCPSRKVLSPQEVARLIDAAEMPFHRILLMTLYATGARRAEVARLKISDVDSERMVIHIQGGKGGKDRDVMLSNRRHTARRPVTTKVLWTTCQRAAERAGLARAQAHPSAYPATLFRVPNYYLIISF
jgi:hypothetical protein